MSKTYTDARYTFTSPTRDCKYVKTLEVIAGFNAKGILPDRALVSDVLHDPKDHGWGSSRWAALRQAGFITSWRYGNKVHYAITSNGIKLLSSVKG